MSVFNLFQCLSYASQQRLASEYKRRFRKEFHPPAHRAEIEKDIDKVMREPGKGVRPK